MERRRNCYWLLVFLISVDLLRWLSVGSCLVLVILCSKSSLTDRFGKIYHLESRSFLIYEYALSLKFYKRFHLL
jgi:hypothetical protein